MAPKQLDKCKNKFNSLKMDQLVHVILAIDKVQTTLLRALESGLGLGVLN